jgi:Leucine-rich repeat (LRR) protein
MWHGQETARQPSKTGPQLAQPNQEELVRKLVREELNRTDASESRGPARPATKRWLSNQPPPIGDLEDDSPPLGLTTRERMPERLGSPPSSLDADFAESAPAKTPPPARPKDDPAAVTALTAAGIRCVKDAETGLVSRVDGSFRMTDALMPHVAKLPGLVELKLSFTDVSDTGLVHIKNLTGLKELVLNQTKISDTGLAQLESLVNLEKLDLEKTLVTDASVERLKALKRLKHVDLRGTQITKAGADLLRQTLPSAKTRH